MLTGYRFNAAGRDGETIHRTAHHVSHDQLMRIVELWREKKDTLDIAREVGLPEYEVSNRLPMLREQFRGVSNG